MKHIFHLTFALLAGMVLCACSSDDPMDNDQAAVPVQPGETGSDDTWSVKIEGDMTRGLSLSGTTLTPNFNGENIYVYYGDTKVGTLTAPSGTGSQVLTGRLNNASYTVGQSLSLYFLKDKGFATYTGQQGTIANIASNFDYATATGTITNVDPNTHTLTINIANFAGQQAVVGLKFSEALNASDVITISNGGLKSNVTVTTQAAVAANSGVVYVALPLNTASSNRTFSISIARSSTTVLKGTISGAAAMANGKYYSTKTVTLIRHMSLVKSSDKGDWIADDGFIYDSGSTLPSGRTKTGVIVYVGTGTGDSSRKHGIALSLTNGSNTNYTTNATTIKGSLASVPSGASAWIIPSIDQWNTILISLKGGSGLTEDANSAYVNVNPGGGATNLNQIYWSTTATGSKNWCYRATSGHGYKIAQGTGSGDSYKDYIRAIYTF